MNGRAAQVRGLFGLSVGDKFKPTIAAGLVVLGLLGAPATPYTSKRVKGYGVRDRIA